MPFVLRHFPDLSYQGFDAASTVIDKIKANKDVMKAFIDPITNRSRITFTAADLSAVPLPGGQDLIFSRDALQHLSLPLVLGILRNFKNAAPRWLMVGSYPGQASVIII